jgi:tetratricopeptide (TPR) repeat protein
MRTETEASQVTHLRDSAIREMDHGNFDQAMAFLDEAFSLCENHNLVDTTIFATVLSAAGRHALLVGEPDTAAKLYNRAVGVLLKEGAKPIIIAQAAAGRAAAQEALGYFREAEEDYVGALDLLAKSDHPTSSEWTNQVTGLLAGLRERHNLKGNT